MELTPTEGREIHCEQCDRWLMLEYVYIEWSERRGAYVHRRTTAAPCDHKPVEEDEE